MAMSSASSHPCASAWQMQTSWSTQWTLHYNKFKGHWPKLFSFLLPCILEKTAVAPCCAIGSATDSFTRRYFVCFPIISILAFKKCRGIRSYNIDSCIMKQNVETWDASLLADGSPAQMPGARRAVTSIGLKH